MTRQMKVGAFLKSLREAKGIPIEQVCKDLGTVYANAEKGKKVPVLLSMIKILDYFKADRMAACTELEYIPKDDQTFRYLVLRKAISDGCSVKDVLRKCKCYPMLYDTMSLSVIRPLKSLAQFREMAEAFKVPDDDFAARMPGVNLQAVIDSLKLKSWVATQVSLLVAGKAPASLTRVLIAGKCLLSKASLESIAKCMGMTYYEAFLWYMEVQGEGHRAISSIRRSTSGRESTAAAQGRSCPCCQAFNPRAIRKPSGENGCRCRHTTDFRRER